MSQFETIPTHKEEAAQHGKGEDSSPAVRRQPSIINDSYRVAELVIENSRLHRLVAELLIKNQQLRKQS